MAELGICSAEGCDKPARQNRMNLCSMHDARMRRGGSLERRVPRLSLAQLLNGREQIGWWTILGEGDPYRRPTADGSPHPDGVIRTAKCRCECGVVRDVAVHTLKQGNSRHCGCKMAEINPALHGTHLMSYSPEYRSWSHMKERCLNPDCADYPDYGGRGIVVCEQWLGSFQAFYADMGPRPEGHSLDRIDVNGNYEPRNCRWANNETQAQNKRRGRVVVLGGETVALSVACRARGVSYKLIHKRMSKGMSFDEACVA